MRNCCCSDRAIGDQPGIQHEQDRVLTRFRHNLRRSASKLFQVYAMNRPVNGISVAKKKHRARRVARSAHDGDVEFTPIDRNGGELRLCTVAPRNEKQIASRHGFVG